MSTQNTPVLGESSRSSSSTSTFLKQVDDFWTFATPLQKHYFEKSLSNENYIGDNRVDRNSREFYMPKTLYRNCRKCCSSIQPQEYPICDVCVMRSSYDANVL